jgi:uncharacterized protein (DUF1800 family)
MAIAPEPLTTLIALNRFGLGARPGDFAAAASDPRGFLTQELKQPNIALMPAGLPDSKTALQEMFQDQERKKAAREKKTASAAPADMAQMPTMVQPGGDTNDMQAAEPPMQPGAQPAPPGQAGAGMAAADGKANGKGKGPNLEQQLYRAEVLARIQKQAGAEAGYVERLVAFWSNHFAVSVAKGQLVRVAAGPFEREAIRPHVLGRFAGMLRAVEQHPAMLFYLDNQRSIGPNSRAGRNRNKGLNENLAREILELHTLGVGSGYTQEDVTSLARILTGWTFAGRQGKMGEPGVFLFQRNWHEPGAQTLLGKRYPQDGIEQGEAALADLSRYPATAKHLATKLVRHFVADDPPPDLVDRIAMRFTETDGDLAAVSLALIEDDASWRSPMTKMRSPSEFLAAITRATGFVPPKPDPVIGALRAMGMVVWGPPGPNGYPDTAAAWASPEAMKVRLDVSWRAAQQIKDKGEPLAVLDTVAGGAASPETRQALMRAESRQQALAILFMSPEFQRR